MIKKAGMKSSSDAPGVAPGPWNDSNAT
jgi:hypothetical protein